MANALNSRSRFMQKTPSFQSSGNAGQDIATLTQMGFDGGNYFAGTREANMANQLGALKQQRAVDPWSYYRGGAADLLAQNTDPRNDPSNIYRSKLQQMMTGEFSPDDPSYQWRFDQGQQTTERSLAARGLLNSGNAAIELQEYGQGAASQEYGAQFARTLQALTGVEDQYSSQMSRLMELAGIGNVSAGIDQKQLDQGIADNQNEQLGLAAALRKKPSFNPGFGSGALG